MEGWVWRRWWGTSSSIDSHVPPVYSCSEDDAEQRARGGSTPRRPRPAQTQTGALRDGRLLADTVSAPSFPVSTKSQQQPGLFSHAGCWNVGKVLISGRNVKASSSLCGSQAAGTTVCIFKAASSGILFFLKQISFHTVCCCINNNVISAAQQLSNTVTDGLCAAAPAVCQSPQTLRLVNRPSNKSELSLSLCLM